MSLLLPSPSPLILQLLSLRADPGEAKQSFKSQLSLFLKESVIGSIIRQLANEAQNLINWFPFFPDNLDFFTIQK